MGLPQSQLYEGLYWGPKSLLHFSGANQNDTKHSQPFGNETGCFSSMSGPFATSRLEDTVAAAVKGKNDLELTEFSILANFESRHLFAKSELEQQTWFT